MLPDSWSLPALLCSKLRALLQESLQASLARSRGLRLLAWDLLRAPGPRLRCCRHCLRQVQAEAWQNNAHTLEHCRMRASWAREKHTSHLSVSSRLCAFGNSVFGFRSSLQPALHGPFDMQQKGKASRASRSLAEQRLGRTSEFARLRRLGLSARSALAAVLHAAPGSLKTFQQSPCASYDKDKLMNEASFTEGAMRFWHCIRSCGQSLLIS